MEFIIGKKYNRHDCDKWHSSEKHNPFFAVGVTSQGNYALESGDHVHVDIYTVADFQAHFTLVTQYPPCSLEDAQVGDTVETWEGQKYPVEMIDKKDTVMPVLAAPFWFTADGYWKLNKKDVIENARFLHKAPKGIEPILFTSTEKTTEANKINELVSAFNSLTDRVAKLEGK